MKLQSFDWKSCVSTYLTPSTWMNIHDILIVAYMKKFGILVNVILFYDDKGSF